MLSHLNHLNHLKFNKLYFKKPDIMFPINTGNENKNNTTTHSKEIIKLKEQVKILTEMLICCQKEMEEIKVILNKKKSIKSKEVINDNDINKYYSILLSFIPITSVALWFYFHPYQFSLSSCSKHNSTILTN